MPQELRELRLAAFELTVRKQQGRSAGGGEQAVAEGSGSSGIVAAASAWLSR